MEQSSLKQPIEVGVTLLLLSVSSPSLKTVSQYIYVRKRGTIVLVPLKLDFYNTCNRDEYNYSSTQVIVVNIII